MMRKCALSVQFLLLAWCLACNTAGATASDIGHYIRPSQKNAGYKPRVIVFVHGIFGDSENTWLNANGAYWPRMLVDDKTFDDSDIYVAAYPTSFTENRISVAGETSILNNRLTNDEVFSKHQEVVFVCHSLGGIIVQELLLGHREYAGKVRFIYFFGTPNTGAQIAKLGHIFNGDPLLQAMFPGDQNATLENMEQQWKLADFKIIRYCAYENKTYKSVLVVDRLSSTRNCDKPFLAIDEDHLGLVKPNSRNHDSYIALANAVRENPMAKSAVIYQPKPKQDTAVSEILTICNSRALFTRMHAEQSQTAMFDSIERCRVTVQKNLPKIGKKELRDTAFELHAALDEIGGKKNISGTPLQNRCDINALKIKALSALQVLARGTGAVFPLPAPGKLAEASYFTQNDADHPPTPGEIQSATDVSQGCAVSINWYPTGDFTIDSVQQNLNTLGPKPSDAQLVSVLRPLFTQPVFMYIGEELPEGALYRFCRSGRILSFYSNIFSNPEICQAALLGTQNLIYLQDIVGSIYGPAFLAQQQCDDYNESKASFIKALPSRLMDRSTMEPRASEVLRKLRNTLRSVGLMDPDREQDVKPTSGDEVKRIENLLAAVPDSYRRLVASVIYAFDPHATLSVGNLVGTPDGIRTVDIEVRSSGEDGAPLLSAIDVIDLPVGRKVDIGFVDAADSKRSDIRADAMLLCSNTGFEQDAISKAKRKNIGLISILRQGDKRVKAIIEEELYLRKIDITPLTITWNGDDLQNLNPNPDILEYNGGSVGAWLALQASLMAGMHPELVARVTGTFNFIKPTDFYKNGKRITLRSMAVSFTPRVQWLSQIVQLDAETGIYDYIRGRVLFAGGPNSYTVSGVDFDRATPLSSPPPVRSLGVGLKPGEVEMSLAKVHGGPAEGTAIAKLDDLIRPEDLQLKLTQEELNKLKGPDAP